MDQVFFLACFNKQHYAKINLGELISFFGEIITLSLLDGAIVDAMLVMGPNFPFLFFFTSASWRAFCEPLACKEHLLKI